MSPRKNNFELDSYYIEKAKRVRREIWLFPLVGTAITVVIILIYELFT